jgi:Protein of unknown function (DUF2961)
MTATRTAARLACALALLGLAAPGGAAADRGPVGWDAFRRVDLLPLLRVGVHARLASSYDRRGGNRDGYRYACRRQVEGRCLLAEHTGAGEVDSMWFARKRGDLRYTGTLRVELDGRTVLDAPVQDVVDGRLGAPFAVPLVANAARSSGGSYVKVPMPFQRSMRITTSRNPNFFHVDYRTFDDATGVPTFDPTDPVPDVLAELRAAGRQIPPGESRQLEALPASRSTAGARMTTEGASAGTGGAGGLVIVGPGTIRQLRFRFVRGTLPRARVTMVFDVSRTVNVPLAALLAGGRSLLAAPGTTWWPMPFRDDAVIAIQDAPGATVEALVDRGSPLPAALARGEAGYFRATWHAGRTRPGRDWTVLDAHGPGLLVGVTQTMTGPRSRRFLEGDDRIVADGALLHGTGTEDFYEGAYYFSRGPFSLPLTGNPVHRTTRATDTTGAYRWRLGDAVPFARHLRFTFEHGDRDRVAARYETVALWYGP